MRILVVEDEAGILDFLMRGLSDEGHTVFAAGDLAQARVQLTQAEPDLLLLDRMLPDGDGLELVAGARAAHPELAIICLTARDRVEDRIEGLYGGADDYLVKPFAFDELLARIAAVFRRHAAPDRLQVGDLIVDVRARRVHRGGDEVRLTAREFDLLRYLAEHSGRVLSRAQLLDAVWGTTHDPRTNLVDVYISYLRAKIDRDRKAALIHTVRGVGYVLEDQPR